MDQIGILRLATDFVAMAEDMKVSEKSVKKMKKWCQEKYLPKLVVATAAVAETGRPFCLATYATEGDEPLSFCVYMVFDTLENFLNQAVPFGDGSRTRQRCKSAAEIVQAKLDPLQHSLARVREEADNLEVNLALLDEQRRKEQESNSTGDTMGRGRRRVIKNRKYKGGLDDNNNGGGGEEAEAEEPVAVDAGDIRAEKEDALAEIKENISKPEEDIGAVKRNIGGLVSMNDYLQYAKSCVDVAYTKYKELFENDADRKRIRKAFLACKVFDVLYLRGKSMSDKDELYRLIDDLANFEFVEFSPIFLEGLKRELPLLLNLVKTMPYDFEGAEPQKERKLFQNRLKQRYIGLVSEQCSGTLISI